MFKKLKDKLKKVEEKAKEVADRELGLEKPPARAPAPPKIGLKIDLAEDLKKVIRYVLDLMLKGDQTRIAQYFEEDVRSRAVWEAFDAMTERLNYSYKDFAKYFDANMEALAGEFMAEYQRAKADLEKRGFIFPDLGLEESLIDSPIGVWEGKFWKYDIFRWDQLEGPPNTQVNVNRIKLSVTQKQTLQEVEVEAEFKLLFPVPFFMSARLSGEMTAEGEIKVKGTTDWGTEYSLETALKTMIPGGEDKSEALKQALEHKMRESPDMRKEFERQMEKMERKLQTSVELTGKVNLREKKMTNKLTGILNPKVPTEEITVGEGEGAMKIRMGNLHFTAYKEK